MREIEIHSDEHGEPVAVVMNEPTTDFEDRNYKDNDHSTQPVSDGQAVRLSISHDGEYAVAIALAMPSDSA